VIVNERPDIKWLDRSFIRGKICGHGNWEDLGRLLLDKKDIHKIGIIKKNDSDVEKQCSAMFQTWLQTQPRATWKQILVELLKIGLVDLAREIELRLQPHDEMVTAVSVSSDNQQQSNEQVLGNCLSLCIIMHGGIFQTFLWILTCNVQGWM